MESSIVEEKLTDGSIAYNVVIVDGAQKTVIAAISKAGGSRSKRRWKRTAATRRWSRTSRASIR